MLKHIPDILRQIEGRADRPKAFNYWNKGVWVHMSSHELVAAARNVALVLHEKGLQKGDRVGIHAMSSPYWIIADFAIVLAGGVTVPLFSNLSEKHFLYEINHAQPKFLFGGDDTAEVIQETFHLEKDIQQLIEQGREIHKKYPNLWKDLEDRIHEDDLATIIYTSGSTGDPKGVELTHKNLVTIPSYEIYQWCDHDKYLSFLPLPHIFAKQVNYIMMNWGVDQYFVNDLPRIGELCQEIHPTAMITVPRMLEKVHAKMESKVHQASGLKGLLGRWAWNLASSSNFHRRKIARYFADKLVYSKLRDALGGKMRVVLCGGSALNPALQEFFLNIGITVVQGWGLTEGSTVAVNRLDSNKVGTCGPPVPEAEFAVSPKGEVLVRGPTVMRGYYKNREATAKAIDAEGWLYTGDKGLLDEDGHLIIEGRISESFKTSQGEFVIPVPIEQQLCLSPLIDMAMVIGENKPYASVLLFPNIEMLNNIKKDGETLEDLLVSRDITLEIESLIHELNKTLDHWEKIHGYRVILQTPTIEGGELTPTMKLRRKVVLVKYDELISDIYEGAEAA
jgi:long-chain acyl-CoA synthetase